jgi:hypothetical protein
MNNNDTNVQVSIGAKIDDLVKEFNQGGNVVAEAIKEMAASVKQSGEVVERACNEMTTAVQRTERGAKDSSTGIMDSFGTAGNFLQGVVGGIIASISVDAVFNFAKDITLAAREIVRSAQLANTSTEEFQRWAFAVKGVGFEQEKLADVLKDVQDRVGDFIATGGGPMVDFFEQIAPRVGVTAQQFAHLSGTEALLLYVDSLQKANVTQSEFVFYMETIANDATALIPLLSDNGRELMALAESADEAGAVMSDSTLQASLDLKDALAVLDIQTAALKNQLISAFAPALEFIVECFTDGSGAATDFSVIFKGVATIVIGATAIIRQAWAIISGLVSAITVSIVSILDAIVKAVTMDWSGAKQALEVGDQMVREALGGIVDNYMEAGSKAEQAMARVWGVGPQVELEQTPRKTSGEVKMFNKNAGKESSEAKERARAEAEAAREKFEYEMELLRTELAEQEKGAEAKLQISRRMVEAIKAQYGEQSREYARALREQTRITEEVEAEKRRIQDAALMRAREQGIFEINFAKEQANMMLATGEITAVQKVEIERRAEEQIYALQLAYLEQRKMLMASEPQEVERINAEIEKLRQEHLIRMQQSDLATFEANKGQWDSYFQSITDGFANAINGMVFQGLTFQQAMGNIFQNILGQLIQTGVKMVANWITTQLGMTSATVTGAAVRTTAEVTSAKTSTMANAGAAIKNIMTKAVEVFANVYNAIAGIPYVGPFLAPVMAVAAGATIVGLVGKVASAEGGWDRVPYDGAQAILHKEEMVLPAPLAEGIRAMVESGQRGNGGVTVQAMDRRDVQRYFDDNADIYMRSLTLASANNPGGF